MRFCGVRIVRVMLIRGKKYGLIERIYFDGEIVVLGRESYVFVVILFFIFVLL